METPMSTSRYYRQDDDRDAQVAELTEQLVRAWNLRLQAGEPRAISDLHNTVLDRLSEDTAASVFVQSVLDPAGAAKRFTDLAAEAMRAECENDALKQLEANEQRLADAAQQDRIEQRVWDHFFAQPA
jgi:hypothetical protein